MLTEYDSRQQTSITDNSIGGNSVSDKARNKRNERIHTKLIDSWRMPHENTGSAANSINNADTYNNPSGTCPLHSIRFPQRYTAIRNRELRVPMSRLQFVTSSHASHWKGSSSSLNPQIGCFRGMLSQSIASNSGGFCVSFVVCFLFVDYKMCKLCLMRFAERCWSSFRNFDFAVVTH